MINEFSESYVCYDLFYLIGECESKDPNCGCIDSPGCGLCTGFKDQDGSLTTK